MKNAFKFVSSSSDAQSVGDVAFGITILFASMGLIIGLLGIATGWCVGKKCQKCCACGVSYHFQTLEISYL